VFGDEFSFINFIIDDLADDIQVIDKGLISKQLAFGTHCPKILIHIL
jgi:hypothetical protein